jgi:glycosyltransferase involved in cell wall biosynthesis
VKILTFTTLYPNAVTPHHGVFVENRLRHLIASGGVAARVVAPVPWFPFDPSLFGGYSRFAKVPAREERFGIPVIHPRYPVIPKVGMTAAPFLMYIAMRPVFRKTIEGGYDFDLIDAHYFYPDGIAAVMLGEHFGKPVSITARGTDLNLVPQYALPRHLIRRTAGKAAGLITVCEALKQALVGLGVDRGRVTVLRNGVDLQTFRPVDRAVARRQLAVDQPVLLSVGHLIPRKGHEVVIEALASLPEMCLLVVGEGPEEPALKALAGGLGVNHRVRFLGTVPHERMREIYGAADVLVLASSREGWPNVLLEAMACGTPVVASDVWGTPEIVTAPEAGVLVRERTPEAVAAAVRAVLAGPYDRAATRAYAERFDWQETTQGQLDLFRDIIERGAA